MAPARKSTSTEPQVRPIQDVVDDIFNTEDLDGLSDAMGVDVSELKEVRVDGNNRMTPEAQAALAAPLDPRYIRTRPDGFKYCDMDYLEGRARAVDPSFSVIVQAQTPGVIICTVTILGVPMSGEAGYYIGDTYEVWDKQAQKLVEKKMTSKVAHTTIGAAKAAAERRAFAMHTLGAELWEKELPDEATAVVSSPVHFRAGAEPSQATSSVANPWPPSPGRLKTLVEQLEVPEAVAMQLSGAGIKGDNGQFLKDPTGRFTVSPLSRIMDDLFAAKKANPNTYGPTVWKSVIARHQSGVTFDAGSSS